MADGGEALNEGADFFSKLQAIHMKAEANAAYNKVYGDKYGPLLSENAENALRAQEFDLNQKLNPNKVEQSNMDLAAHKAVVDNFGPMFGDPDAVDKAVSGMDNLTAQQHMRGYVSLGLLAQSAQPDERGAYSKADVTKMLGSDGSRYGLSDDQFNSAVTALTSPNGKDHVDGLRQALLGAGKFVGQPVISTNGDIARFGSNGAVQITKNPFAPSGGTPVAAENAASGAQKAAAATENAVTSRGKASNAQTGDVTLPSAPVAAPAANAKQTGGVSNQALDKLIDDNKGDQKAILQAASRMGGDNLVNAVTQRMSDRLTGASGAPTMANKPPQPEAVIPPQIANLDIKHRGAAIAQAQQITNQKTTIDNIDRIIGTMDSQVTPFTAGTGSLLKEMPGTEQANLKANLKTLSAMGLTTWINSLKNASGQTGIGRVLKVEAEQAMTLYGNMEQDQSAKQLKFHMKLFQDSVHQLYEHQQQAFKAQYQVDAFSALGMDQPQGSRAADSAAKVGAGSQASPQEIVDEMRRRKMVK